MTHIGAWCAIHTEVEYFFLFLTALKYVKHVNTELPHDLNRSLVDYGPPGIMCNCVLQNKANKV